MTEIRLTRDGKRPLIFEGELLLEDDSRGQQGPTENRWGSVEVYKTSEGNYAVKVTWDSLWQGEQPREDAEIFETSEEVADWLEVSAPPSYWGYPLGPQYEAKQARIAAAIRHSWEKCVSRVLDKIC